jgi:hypothetical protein
MPDKMPAPEKQLPPTREQALVILKAAAIRSAMFEVLQEQRPALIEKIRAKLREYKMQPEANLEADIVKVLKA